MTYWGQQDHRGLYLDEFFDVARHIVFTSPHSVQQIKVAIQTLAYPREVSCTTFEIILSMKRYPYCIHLPLLLSSPGIVPSCIRLLREYTMRDGILDYGYGYFCIDVMVLAIEVGILSQTGKLESFIADISNLPDHHFISQTLISYLGPMVKTALKGRPDSGMGFLLGWELRALDNELVCLPQIGGVTIKDAKFLIEQLWVSRKNFSEAAQWAAGSIPGWSRFILVLWQALLRHSDPSAVTVSQRSNERYWKFLTDIVSRYSLFSGQHEDELLPPILTYCLGLYTAPGLQTQPPTFVDLDDSKAIATGFSQRKTKATPPAHIVFISALFRYTCVNLDPKLIHAQIPQIFSDVLERAWVELEKASQLNNEQWGDLGTFVGHFFETTQYLLSLNQSNKSIILEALTDEILFDLLGRIVLYPTFSPGRFLAGVSRRSWVYTLQGSLLIFCRELSSSRQAAQFEPGPMAFYSWNKTLLCLHTQTLTSSDTQQLTARYVGGCEKVWMELGKTLGIRSLRDQGCANPRCAAPDVPMYWQCNRCHAALYCTKSCQASHWMYAPDPHKAKCPSNNALRAKGEQWEDIKL